MQNKINKISNQKKPHTLLIENYHCLKLKLQTDHMHSISGSTTGKDNSIIISLNQEGTTQLLLWNLRNNNSLVLLNKKRQLYNEI